MAYSVGDKVRFTTTIFHDYDPTSIWFYSLIGATKGSIVTILSAEENYSSFEVRIDSIGPYTEEESKYLACNVGDVIRVGFMVIEPIE